MADLINDNDSAYREKPIRGAPKDNTITKEEMLIARLNDFNYDADGYSNRQRALDVPSAIGDIASIVDTTINIAASSRDLFKLGKQAAKQSPKLESLKASIRAGIRMDFTRISELFPYGEFNPHFNLFKEQVGVFAPDLLEESKLLSPNIHEQEESYVKLNKFVNAIRQGSKQEGFIKSTQHHIRNSNKNQKSLREFINRLFLHKSKLLVLRVDLAYKRDYGLGSENPITYEETDRHRKAFINALRNDICKSSFVGYAWKLEYGLKTTFHYHFLIFLDASLVWRDITIAEHLGKHWENEITGGKGRYWNCNVNKKMYRDCGLGEIPHNDLALRNDLEKAASYLIKADYVIRSAIPSNRRTFGKGADLPKVKSNLGRPRKT